MQSYIIHPESNQFTVFREMPGFCVEHHEIDKDVNKQYLLCGIIVKSNGLILGRVAVYKNPFHKVEDTPVISLGYYESINDQTVADLLFERASDLAKLYNCTSIIGPINGSTWKNYRYQTGGVSDPFFLEYKSPEYYLALWRNSDFTALAHYLSERIDLDQSVRKINTDAYYLRTGIRVRGVNIDSFESDLTQIGVLSLDSFRQNFLYSPIGILDFKEMYLRITDWIDPNLVLVAEDEGEVVGYIFAVRNYNDTSQKGVIIKTLARSNNTKYRGLGSVLSAQLIDYARSVDYDYVINAYFHSDNLSNNTSKKFNAKPYKEYELLTKTV